MSNGVSDKEILRNALKKCKTAVYWIFATSFVINILMLIQSIYMLQLFSRVLSGHRLETLTFLTLITIFAIGILSLLLWVRTLILQSVGQWLTSQLTPAALIRSPDQLLKGVNYGTQSISDVNQIAGFVSTPGMIAFLDIPWIPIYLIFLFILHFALGIITVIGAVLLIIFAVLNEWITRVPYQEANKKFVRNQILIDTTMRNSETIQAMGMMESILDNWQKKQNEAKNMLAPTQRKASYIQYTTHFLRLALQILIMAAGAYLVLQGTLSAGGMIAASIALSRALAPLENGIASWQSFSNARVAYRRLMIHLMSPVRDVEAYLAHTPKGKVEVQGLYYLPAGTNSKTTKPILDNINFSLEPGESLAIIGASGSGKTSLARLITGVYEPSRGAARLDGAPTYLWNRRDFGKYVGYLPQSIELFDGTIAQNIARMDTHDKDKIVEAAAKAGVHQTILQLPNGFDTDVGTYGSTLSGGMRQRIALARAMYGNPPLLVLDEPNSNLDDEGVVALIKALGTMKEEKKTVVLITHHRNLLGLVDKILFLQQGQIYMYGPTNQVFEKLQEMTRKTHQTQQQPPYQEKNSNV